MVRRLSETDKKVIKLMGMSQEVLAAQREVKNRFTDGRRYSGVLEGTRYHIEEFSGSVNHYSIGIVTDLWSILLTSEINFESRKQYSLHTQKGRVPYNIEEILERIVSVPNEETGSVLN